MTRPLVLIGLMGTGKTSVGTLLAGALGHPLRDSDTDILSEYGLSAAELAGRWGAARLHDIEAGHLLAALDDPAPSVVCAAASTIERPECRQRLFERAFVAWLDAPPDVLARRFDSGPHRPRFQADISAMLADQYARRAPLFGSAADIRLDVSTTDVSTVASTVLAAYHRVRVVVLGSANMDLVARTPSLPLPGETVLGHGFRTVPGGKGANQAVAVARAGGQVTFIAAVGTDPFGAALRAALIADGVDTSLVREVDGPSGVALIAVDDAGENSIVVAPGANSSLLELTSDDIAAIRRSDVLVAQLEVPVDTVALAGQISPRVVLNAAPAVPLPAPVLSTVDLLVVNRVEAATVAGRDGTPDELASALLELVPRVVLTLGSAGAQYADREGLRVRVPAPEVDTVDSTAAGDAFTAALALAWAEGRPMTEALRWACAAGAASTRRPGAYSSLPTRAEIDSLYTPPS